jgi:trehalose 6-phosphate phosphatase
MLASYGNFLDAVAGKRVVVFLDYDGTLTPIVSKPDQAHLAPSMREIVHAVAQTFPTAIISGRGRSKVEAFVQLSNLFYAGSHGLDIRGPAVRPLPPVLNSPLSFSSCDLNRPRLILVNFSLALVAVRLLSIA